MHGPLSALDPAGPGAAHAAQVWWAMFGAGMALLALMTALGTYAVLRPRTRTLRRPYLLLAVGGIALPVTGIVALLGYDVWAGAQRARSAAPAYVVEATGHQWYWSMRHAGADGQARYAVNVLHIPAGQPVEVRIGAADVIHSFWVPRLAGKLDAIPGRTNVLRLQADAPGIYRGQCAEFCGLHHARMPFEVHAHADPQALAQAVQALSTVELQGEVDADGMPLPAAGQQPGQAAPPAGVAGPQGARAPAAAPQPAAPESPR